MATLESLRHQIDTANDLESVVSTMKTLAAVNIRQYERAVEAIADFRRTIELGFRIVLEDEAGVGDAAEVGGNSAMVVFGSDQGMCGRFNEEIVSFADARAHRDDLARHWTVLAVGARAEDGLLDAGWSVDRVYDVPSSVSDITNLVHRLLPDVERLRAEAGVSRLLAFFNHRKSASSYEPQRLQLLPLDADLLRRWRSERWRSRSLPTFATSRRRLLSRLVQQYLFMSLFHACAASLASENASRIAAMQAAERSIEEQREELQRAFNQLRQTAITDELLDVVTGFEALLA
jgi:F-type H+-transporting ATPase subunit gamma